MTRQDMERRRTAHTAGKEQQYIDAGQTRIQQSLQRSAILMQTRNRTYTNKYKSQGYNATDAKKLANYEIVHGEERAKNYAANNVKKSGPDYTATSQEIMLTPTGEPRKGLMRRRKQVIPN